MTSGRQLTESGAGSLMAGDVLCERARLSDLFLGSLLLNDTANR